MGWPFNWMSAKKDVIETGAGIITGVMGGVADIVDQFIENPQEKADLLLALKNHELAEQQSKRADVQIYLDDKDSARKMQIATKSKAPGRISFIFITAYFILVGILIYTLTKWISLDVPNYIVAFVSTIFSSVSTLVGMIVAFYFGSSQAGEAQQEQVSQAVGDLAKAKNQE